MTDKEDVRNAALAAGGVGGLAAAGGGAAYLRNKAKREAAERAALAARKAKVQRVGRAAGKAGKAGAIVAGLGALGLAGSKVFKKSTGVRPRVYLEQKRIARNIGKGGKWHADYAAAGKKSRRSVESAAAELKNVRGKADANAAAYKKARKGELEDIFGRATPSTKTAPSAPAKKPTQSVPSVTSTIPKPTQGGVTARPIISVGKTAMAKLAHNARLGALLDELVEIGWL